MSHDDLTELCSKSFKDQAVWFMNAYWDEFASAEAENFWRYVQVANQVDVNGNGRIDELEGHRFLELLKEEMTVMSMRKKLRETRAISEGERPQTVPLTHYLLFKYGVSWEELLTKPQGGDPAEVAKAEAMLKEVMEALAQAEATAASARQAVIAAKQAVDAAKQAEVFAQQKAQEEADREAELVAAKAELAASLAEVQREEDAYNNRTEELKRKSKEGGIVSQGKAKNDLAVHLAEDPLPLRKAKITAEAALKKNERAVKAAAEARVAAENAAEEARKRIAEAEGAKEQAEKAKAEADAAVVDAEQKVAETEAFVEEVKNSLPQGQLWWLERELHEAKAYLPQRAGGYKK
eukprot:CAMPEP_0174269366 /NCGR_PEP_ID=MMETSP0439-20130205/40762_1 /TAXON_ID=0 /ORGANISM="Stereomyxa ramosa, Strain Chinc5" /LENGTH=350 /DNA_ID=CAMNT_0015358101 /DNA_START=13 /DNA_END=1065 /DNA_ORIENTATION=+